MSIYYWRTKSDLEVDFILYGNEGFFAIEFKRTSKISNNDLTGLVEFKKDYPEAKAYLFYSGKQKLFIDGIKIIPMNEAIQSIQSILTNSK